MKKDKELGASTDAGEVGTLAVSLTGLATRRVARTTVSPSAAPGLTDGSNMAKAVVTRDVAGCGETAVRYSFLVLYGACSTQISLLAACDECMPASVNDFSFLQSTETFY